MTRKRKLAGAVSREKMLLIYVTDQTMVEGLFCSHKTATKLVVIKGSQTSCNEIWVSHKE